MLCFEGFPFRHHKKHLLMMLALCTATFGCKGFESNLQDTKVDYRTTAQENYDQAEAAVQDERYNEAIKLYEYVKNKFPYSRYAVSADLAIADCHYAKEQWLEAADAYRLFARFHPRDDKVPYATFRAAAAYYYEIYGGFFDGKDIFIMSSLHTWFTQKEERDLTAIADAIRAFDEYLIRFPKDDNASAATEMRARARRGLAAHDFYAAEFYQQRGHHRGAIWRYEEIARKFDDTPLAADALLRGTQIARDDVDDLQLAQSLCQQVIQQHSESEFADTAKNECADIEREISKRRTAGTLKQTLWGPWDPRGPGPWQAPEAQRQN